jgi:hypothetical protein
LRLTTEQYTLSADEKEDFSPFIDVKWTTRLKWTDVAMPFEGGKR